MMNFKIELLPVAQSDLVAINDYIAKTLYAPAAATELLNKFIDAFEQLQKMPFSGTKLSADIPLKYSYRWTLVGNYYLFHTINEQTETVTIMRIIYAKSNYIKILEQ